MTVGVTSFVVGIGLNVYLKHFNPKILTAPLYARIGFRVLLAVTPVVLGSVFFVPGYRTKIN